MLAVLPVVFAVTLILGVCVSAFVFGGKAERYGALCILSANIVAEGLILLDGGTYPSDPVFIIDLMLAVALLVIAIRYSSLWLGGAMILQSIALYIHVLKMMGDEISSNFYVVLNDDLTFVMLGCIASGIVSQQWRKKKGGLTQDRLNLKHQSPHAGGIPPS